MKEIFDNYFASCNGFSGFRSYFDEIFNPGNFEHIFILKGGPGTGKSTLMKKAAEKYESSGARVERIWCSSDKNSLDGIIIDNGKKYGILDGTAPHTKDPSVPGAVEEIVNLGDNWNVECLKEHKDEIITLNNEKSKHYKDGYRFLSLAGKVYEEMKAITSFEENRCLFDGRNIKFKIISSFSKDGLFRLLSPDLRKKAISVKGDLIKRQIFYNQLIDKARGEIILLLSPLSQTLLDGIYINDGTLYISDYADAEKAIDVNTEIKISFEDTYAFLEEQMNTYLDKAKFQFALASKKHFALEKIYTPAMSFDDFDSVYSKIFEIIDAK